MPNGCFAMLYNLSHGRRSGYPLSPFEPPLLLVEPTWSGCVCNVIVWCCGKHDKDEFVFFWLRSQCLLGHTCTCMRTCASARFLLLIWLTSYRVSRMTNLFVSLSDMQPFFFGTFALCTSTSPPPEHHALWPPSFSKVRLHSLKSVFQECTNCHLAVLQWGRLSQSILAATYCTNTHHLIFPSLPRKSFWSRRNYTYLHFRQEWYWWFW